MLGVLFLSVALVSCESHSNGAGKKEALASELQLRVIRKLREENNLLPYGMGSGIMRKIHFLGLHFVYLKEVEMDEARQLLMRAARTLLDEMNSDEAIRGYLKSYPCGVKGVEIAIFFRKESGHDPDLDKLKVVDLVQGKITYKIGHENRYDYTNVMEESFEQAASKLGTRI
jgi:hypothetical protein